MRQTNIYPDQDSYINQAAVTTNYSGGTALVLAYDAGETDSKSALLRFAIPYASALILSATLNVYAYQEGDCSANIYYVKRNWVDAQVTWNAYSTGNNWQTAGCRGLLDKSADVMGTLSMTAVGWYAASLNLTQLASMITSGYGMIIVPSANWANLYSNEGTYPPYLSLVVNERGSTATYLSDYGVL
jgi:hypothetical protein